MEHSISTLKDLGLSEPEAQIYLALIKLGGSVASVVAKETGLKRTTAYPILKALANKGFVTIYFRKNKRFYYAEKPHRVINYFSKKLEAFEQIIPLMESLEKKQTQSLGLRFIETKEELENFYRDILIEYKNKQYCIIGSASGWEGVDPPFFIQFRKDRGNAKIKTRLLLTADSRTINPPESELLRDWRYLPEKYTFKSTIDIYDDKILVSTPELSSLAVVIAVPAMVDIFKSVFEILWDQFKAVKYKT